MSNQQTPEKDWCYYEGQFNTAHNSLWCFAELLSDTAIDTRKYLTNEFGCVMVQELARMNEAFNWFLDNRPK